MIKLVNQYKLEIASVPLEPDSKKVYYVSTEINPTADRFVEDNLEEIRDVFEQEGLEFVYIGSKIGKDVCGQIIPPTVFSYAVSKETDKGTAFSAYHLDLDKEELGESLISQLYDVARAYCKKSSSNIRFRVVEDKETVRLLNEFERTAKELRKKGVKPSVFDRILSSLSTAGELIVDINGNLVIPDFDNEHIKMNPIEKALYLLLLQHPEGIEPDAIVGYRSVLLRIYRHFTIFDDNEIIENSIDNLLSEDKGALYTHISRLNKKIETKLGERGSRPYKIQFRRKPDPGRYLVDVPTNNITWQQWF